MNNNKLLASAAFTLIGIGLVGCGKKADTTPGLPSVLTAWQQGDKPTAVRGFVETDWNARPMFAPGSPLNLTEGQFQLLTASERNAKMKDVTAQVNLLRQLALAVIQAGQDAAGKKDSVQARKHFTSVKEYGAALGSADTLLLVKIIGRSLKEQADKELSKLGP